MIDQSGSGNWEVWANRHGLHGFGGIGITGIFAKVISSDIPRKTRAIAFSRHPAERWLRGGGLDWRAFMRACVLSAVAGLMLANLAPAQPIPARPELPAPVPPIAAPPAAAMEPGNDRGPIRLWGSVEYLLGWTKGQFLPPLVTTSPVGTLPADAGVLGQPATAILFGNERVNTGVRDGGRFSIGYWLDDSRTLGLG